MLDKEKEIQELLIQIDEFEEKIEDLKEQIRDLEMENEPDYDIPWEERKLEI